MVEGRPTPVTVKGRELVLTLWHGKVFATRAVCPHQQASLVGGVVRSRLTAGQAVGQVSLSREQAGIACPWHSWIFDLDSGVCTSDSSLRVRSYKVKVDDGSVLVDVET
jgi:nitrite reductase/ring-hydroxylating ferredoxin subunit